MKYVTLANSLSASRIVLAPATMWSLVEDRAALSVLLFGIVIASDLVDGRIARRRQQVSALGTLIDHGSDAIFVTALCGVGAWLSLIPIALPILITFAFLHYVLDSRGSELRGSRLGRWNGIGYFVIVGALLGVHHFAEGQYLHRILYGCGWLLVVTTLMSIALRARRL
ncbi:MAG: hypothetical protein EXR86_05755 [Gammaproteobacteria bacterium]|nr:hypothetical protein [Gammaproteobacteria bacterium]